MGTLDIRAVHPRLLPRTIAAELNALGVPSARGKTWSLTAISPDAKHAGILGNPIYNGRQIWNRAKWIKDPLTGRRKRILRPESEWVITENPELKIVDDDTWNAARERTLKTRARTARQRVNLRRACISGGREPKYLFSGLLRCGCCGSSYVVVDRYRYGCSAQKDRGSAACSNDIKIPRDVIERTLLTGIKKELLSEQAYRAFEAEVRSQLKSAQPDIGEARRAAAKAQAEVDNIIGAIRQGIITPATKRALEDAEARLDAAKRRIKEIETWQPTQMLPRAKQIYRTLTERLERIEDVANARKALRSILGE